MKTIIVFFSLILIAMPAFGSSIVQAWSACELPKRTSCKSIRTGEDLYRSGFTGDVELQAEITTPISCESGDCWLFLGEIADTGMVFLDSKLLAKYGPSPSPFYIRDQSILIPIGNLEGGSHQIKIDVKDLNETIFGMRTENVQVGDYASMRVIQIMDYFKRTGLTLITASSTMFLFLALLFISLVSRRKIDILNCLYSFSVTLYLASFSEVFRPYLDPIFAAGPLHFTFRLLQDLIFLGLIMVGLNTVTASRVFNKSVPVVYGFVIGVLWIMYLSGVNTYRPYLVFLYIVAPLVALPSVYGLYCSLNLQSRAEKRLLITFFTILVPFQLNDLLSFWQIYRGFFFVRIYPVFTILVFLFISVRRASESTVQLEADAELGRTTAGLIHDFKTPLSSLKLVASLIDDERGARRVAYSAIEQIEQLSSGTLSRFRQNLGFELNLDAESIDSKCAIQDVLEAVKVLAGGPAFSSRNIVIESYDVDGRQMIPVNFHQIFRVICNLMENAFDSGPADSPVKFLVEQRDLNVIFRVSDSGSGIPSKYHRMIGSRGFSLKSGGNGVGLWSSKKIVEEAKGKLRFNPNIPRGTTAEVEFTILT